MSLVVRLAMLVRVAWRSLLRNKVRTLLTMLGIIIGVAAVIAMVAIGRGAQGLMEKELLKIGKNRIEVRSAPHFVNGVESGQRATLEVADVEDLKAACPAVQYVSPEIGSGDLQVVYHDQNLTTNTEGVAPDDLAIRHWRVSQGEGFSAEDVRQSARVCILGAVAADALFGNRDPIGRDVRVKAMSFRVVGVRQYEGQSEGWFGDEDKMVYLPYTTALRYIRRSQHFWSMTVTAVSPDTMEAAKDQVQVFLRQHHHIHGGMADDFRLDDIEAMLNRWRQQEAVFSALLGGVASISLLIGGIGIMNIMLVTVTERIREIGTRMALGARPVDIMLQFFMEALTMSLTGGALGIVLGVGMAHVIDRKWAAAEVSPDSLVLAFGVSLAIGVFFGFYPAFKASQLDPIQALRHE